MQGRERAFRTVLTELRRDGLLLESDRKFPSVVNLVLHENVQGSWWAHKDVALVFGILTRLKYDPEALVTKMVSGKVTFVHRRLWPDLLAICTSREPWQTADLTGEAKTLLDMTREAEVRTDTVAWGGGKRAVGDVARELEMKLLIQSEEIHTIRGSHAKILRSWTRWSEIMYPSQKSLDVAKAKGRFERLVMRLNAESGSRGRLPWPSVTEGSLPRKKGPSAR